MLTMKEVEVTCSQDVVDLANKYGRENIKFRYTDKYMAEEYCAEGAFNLIEAGQIRTNEYNLFLDSNAGDKGLLQFHQFVVLVPTPTFNDLIDVAVQAQKDGLIHKMEIISKRSLYISEKPTSKVVHYNLIYIDDGIDYINSLYTETFVIEFEEDCKRIKQMAKITFMNGNSVVMDNPPCDTGIVRIWNDGRYDFTVLKGATVTQKRGAL